MAQGVKAREATVLSKKPFLPTGSDREPVRPIDSHLRTELRSEERRQYEQRRKEKEAEMEAARQQVCIKHALIFPLMVSVCHMSQ